MKKALHIIFSYLGYILFFSGLIASIVKWVAILLSIPTSENFPIISLAISITLGAIIAFITCKPIPLKKNRRFEKYHPVVFAIVFISIVILLENKLTTFYNLIGEATETEFLTIIITLESTLFGFLLAVLAIILQLKGKVVALIRKHDRFNELISYNKNSVYSCAWVIVLSSVLILLNKTDHTEKLTYLASTALLPTLIYNFFAIKRFLSIFYYIAKSD